MFTCVALGKFDGVHLGHKRIIDKTLEISKSKKLMKQTKEIYQLYRKQKVLHFLYTFYLVAQL